MTMNLPLPRAFPLAALALLAACTSTVQTEVLSTDRAPPPEGVVYYLPIRTFQVETKFIITDCGATSSGTARLIYDVVPTVTSEIATDRRRAFSIRGATRSRALQSLNFEIAQYENGALRTFNSTIEDRTAETVTNVLTGASRIALGFTGFSAHSSALADQGEAWLRNMDGTNNDAIVQRLRAVCGRRVTDALLRLRELSGRLDGARESSEAKAALETAVANAERRVVDARTGLRAANELKAADDVALATGVLSRAVTALSEARANLERFPQSASSSALSQQMAAIVQRDLTFTASQSLVPPESAGGVEMTIELPAERLQTIGVNAEAPMKAQILVQLLFARQNREDAGAVAVPSLPATAEDGIYVRMPASGRLTVCASTCTDNTRRFSQTYSIPQWGAVARLPLNNMMFGRSGAKLAFAADGTLTSLGFESTAAAERGSAAFAQAGEILTDFVTRRRELRSQLAAAASASERQSVQDQIDLLTLQQRLAEQQTSPAPGQARALADLQAQIQQTRARIELLELQARERQLSAQPE